MSTHIVSQIKREVQEAHNKQYSLNKEKKELKYFSLYLKSIVKIQRYFRGFLVRKGRRLEKQIAKQLQRKQSLHFKEKSLAKQIYETKGKRQKLKSLNITKMVDSQKENMSENVKQIIRNVVESADKYARNSAIAKFSLAEVQQLSKQEKQLRAEIKELQLEKHCFEQRISNWNAKLKQIREKIVLESSVKSQLAKELEQQQ